MKKLLLFFLSPYVFLYSQWQNIWTSTSIPSTAIVGYLNFQKIGSNWDKRIYYLDSVRFYISSSPTSLTPQYTYIFTPEEKLAGYQLYSLQTDLTGDGITEFYVLGYVGTSSDYRQTVKIFNIVNNSIVFNGNQNNFSFSSPSLLDINSDGLLECVFVKYSYPFNGNYFIEVYSTGVTPVEKYIEVSGYNLNQNYPNPFNSETNITFNLDKEGLVQLKIFDVNGEEVAEILNEYKTPGEHKVKWDGFSKVGKVPSGVYFYQLNVEGNKSVKKMLHLK